MNENGYQKKMLDVLAKHGGGGFKSMAKEIAGYPDLIVCMPNNKTWLIEVKMGDFHFDKLQLRIARRLSNWGFYVAGICIYIDGKKEYAIRFDWENEFELERLPLANWPLLIWRP